MGRHRLSRIAGPRDHGICGNCRIFENGKTWTIDYLEILPAYRNSEIRMSKSENSKAEYAADRAVRNPVLLGFLLNYSDLFRISRFGFRQTRIKRRTALRASS